MTVIAPLPSLIRARMSGANTALVRLRMKHEMESGHRLDAQGKPVAAWHINAFTLSLNGRPVLSGQPRRRHQQGSLHGADAEGREAG